jgi:hypothetical protein
VMGFLLHFASVFVRPHLLPSERVSEPLLGSRSQSILALPLWRYQCSPCIHPCLYAIGICSYSAPFGWMREHSQLRISCRSASHLGISHSILDSPFQDVFQTYARSTSFFHQQHLYAFAFIPRLKCVGFLLWIL